MNALSLLLNRMANWKTLLIFISLYLFFAAYLLKNAEGEINRLAGKEIGVIDLTFGINPQKTMQMVAAYGEDARQYYAKIEMSTDIAYPMVYAFLFGIILTLLYKNTKWEWLQLLPFITMMFDYSENIFIIYLLKTFPTESSAAVIFCEIFKCLKWASLGLIIFCVLGGFVMKFAKRRI